MYLLRSEYKVENNKPAVYLFQREDGKRVVTVDNTHIPYFYCPADEIGRLAGIRHDKETYEAIDGTRVHKVYVTLPEDVPKIRDTYSKTYEADVLFPLRYIIDNVDTIEPTTPKVCFIDLETDNVGRVPNPALADLPITCVGIHDNINDIYTSFAQRSDISPGVHSEVYDDRLHEIHYFKTEVDMLNSVVEFVNKEEPDVISGWNVIRFDMLYLINRLLHLRIDSSRLSPMSSVYIREHKDVVIKGVAIIDLYDAYRRFSTGMEESYKLDFIAKKVIGEGKTDGENNVRYLWKRNLKDLIQYNINDVRITRGINDKLRLLDFMDELRRISFCQLEDTLTTNRTADCYILRLFHGKKVFPTRTHHEKAEYEGAFVGSWATGVYENVAIFDLRSLYPSIIVSCNLSPESIVKNPNANSIHINNLNIAKSPKGFLPQVIENLFKERGKYKELAAKEKINSENWKLYDTRQYAIKILLNALYGQTAYVGSRTYEPRIAETVTFMGREIIKWSKSFLENSGYDVLYVDTDSVFVLFDEINIPQMEYVLQLLNDSYDDFVKQFGIEKHIFSMEFKEVCRKAFFGKAKKRYAGAICYEDGQEVDDIRIMGFEVRRSDSSQFSRDLQHKVFDMLLRQDKTKEEILRYIGDEIDRIRKGGFSFTEIGIPKGINKDLNDYGNKILLDKEGKVKHRSSVPANVRGAKYTTKVLGYELSSKPKLIYVSRMPNGLPQTDVLCFDEDNQVPPGVEIDAEKMLDRLVKAKLESIFEALGWKLSDLVPWWRGKAPSQGQQMSLFAE